MLSWTFNHILKFNFMPQVFVRYCDLKNPAFWFFFRFFVHNSRTRFLETCCFCKKYKKNIGTLCCCIFIDKTFAKTLKTYFPSRHTMSFQTTMLKRRRVSTGLGTFKPNKPSLSELIFKNWDLSFFLLYDVKLHGKK